MKKHRVIVLILAMLCCFMTACNQSKTEINSEPVTESNISRDDKSPYEAYISDIDAGYEAAPFFYGNSSLYGDAEDEQSSLARKYYDENVRQCGDYLITDYEDGVCINRYDGNSDNIVIPETLDEKPVVKLGAYPETEQMGEIVYYDAVSAFNGIRECVLNIPSTVKYINMETVSEYVGYINSEEEIGDSPEIVKINVDEDNPYYCSDNGVLFTKDKKTLLYLDIPEGIGISEDNKKIPPEGYSIVKGRVAYEVPDNVEVFAPQNGIAVQYGGCLIFGKNIKEIDTCAYDSEGINVQSYGDDWKYHDYRLLVKGYKGTVAEKWAEENYLEFIALD